MIPATPTALLAVERITHWARRQKLDLRANAETGAGAIFSRCGHYRYLLWRRPLHGLPFMAFAMLNPSIADADSDDPTIRRCTSFAVRAGMSGPLVWNLFALCATRPQTLKASRLPIGNHNTAAIDLALQLAGTTVAAWGAHGSFRLRDQAVLAQCAAAGARLHALRHTKSGQPGHPLYLRADIDPQPWEYSR